MDGSIVRYGPTLVSLMSAENKASRKIVSRHLGGAKILDVRTRESNTAKYISVSCTIEATSREQLDAIYLDLNSESDILLTL